MSSDAKSFLTFCAMFFVFVLGVVGNNISGNKHKIDRAAEMYNVCVNAQKSTLIDMKCGRAE